MTKKPFHCLQCISSLIQFQFQATDGLPIFLMTDRPELKEDPSNRFIMGTDECVLRQVQPQHEHNRSLIIKKKGFRSDRGFFVQF